MIVQPHGEGLLLFRQTDHALLSGAFADAWAWEIPERGSVVVAAARHDDGWADWELAPTLGCDGRPVDFMRVPVREHVELYRRGIDLVEAEDPYAAAAVSLHGERLYTRPFTPAGRPRIAALTGEALQLAEAYVRHEQARQRRLAEALSARLGRDVRPELEEAWRLIQVWDRLSLFVCMTPLAAGASARMPPVRGPDGADLTIEIQAVGPEAVVVDPYPFDRPGRRFAIEAFELAAARWDDEASYRHAYRTAPRRILSFTAHPQ